MHTDSYMDYDTDSYNTYLLDKELNILQTIFYRYISLYTNNIHLRITFSFFGLIPENRKLSPDELLSIFPHKNHKDLKI
jgi:hypothetical protein